MSDETVIREFFEAWNDKDWERWGAMHAVDVVHAGPDHAQALHGRQEVLEAHTGLGNVFPDFTRSREAQSRQWEVASTLLSAWRRTRCHPCSFRRKTWVQR